MTHPSRLRPIARSLVALTALQAFLPGCQLTETTTTVRAQSQAPTERIRLERPDSAPLSGAWQQNGTTLVGQLAFTNACGTETVQRTKLVQVKDTHPNRRTSTAAYIAGSALAVMSLALFANSQGKSEHVTCGSGDGEPVAGNRCDSEAGAWRSLGAITLGAGVGAILGGAIVASRKPVVTSKDLPSQERVLVSPGPKSCGDIAALQGSQVAATLSTGGKWTSTVDADGSVHIDLRGASIQRDTVATLTVESIGGSASDLVPIGTRVGQLELQPPRLVRALASAR